jgi:hypothetical protein
MNVILFGATGMVGKGVLRECLLDPSVERVLVIGRTRTGATHDKVREILLRDVVLGGLYPALKRLFPKFVTTTEQMGRAMIAVATNGAPKPVLENADINAVGA